MAESSELWYTEPIFMFIDHTPSIKSVPPEPTPVPVQVVAPWWRRKPTIIAASGLALVLIAAGVWAYFHFRSPSAAPTPAPTEQTPSNLPENLQPSPGEPNGGNSTGDSLKGESITFGSFYKPHDKDIAIKLAAVSLPLNVKRDVANYYEITRKINLDSSVTAINANGFALADMPFAEGKTDFFAAYGQLAHNGVPLLISSDFLVYYYQNSLKAIYKDLEASYFYDSVWKVNKQLFDAANTRYQERRQKLGVSNDPLLEAERLEASYAAVALALLAPTADQLNAAEDLNDTTRFKPSEAQRYQFTPPSYLSEDVAKEVALIRGAKQIAKSPLFLYSRNYAAFKTPAEYSSSAQLKNFYAATVWQATLFPLMYRSPACPDCLLDKDDWTINQTAAFLLADDMAASQSLKNEWARIYKVMGYFNGLRTDLTYLNYAAVRAEMFPKKTIDDIFGSNAFASLESMTKKLGELNFRPAEGGVDRSVAGLKKEIGLRLLQPAFSPEPYLYSRLTFAPAGLHNKPAYDRATGMYLTACSNPKTVGLYRCKGIGFDILAGVSDVKPVSAFISDNINYAGYSAARASLAKELSAMSVDAWHSTAFWTGLDITRSVLAEQLPVLPYARTKTWSDRQMQLVLSTMTSVGLPLDRWEATRNDAVNRLGASTDAGIVAYIEPGQALIDEMDANASMLFQALIALGVVKDNDIALSDLTSRLSGVRSLMRKELSGEMLSADDSRFLVELVGSRSLSQAGSKTASVSFVDPASRQPRIVKHSLLPLKLLWLVYKKDGKEILTAGPVFSYKEE